VTGATSGKVSKRYVADLLTKSAESAKGSEDIGVAIRNINNPTWLNGVKAYGF